jgi:hypothetical protein
MNKVVESAWVEVQDHKIWFRGFASTAERRLVYYAQGQLDVKPIGYYRVGLLDGLDAVAAVKMTAQVIDLTLSGGLHSKDGVPLKAGMSLTTIVRDTVPAIKKVVLAGPTDNEHLSRVYVWALQHLCQAYDYLQLPHALPKLAGEAMAMAARELAKQDCPFEIQHATILELKPQDATLEHHLRERAVREEKRRVADQEAARQEAAAAGSRKQRELEEDLKRQLEQKELELAKARALILNSPGGLMALHPDKAIALEIAKLKNDQERQRAREQIFRQLLPMIMNAGFQKGQITTVMKFAAQRLGIDINLDDDNEQSLPALPYQGEIDDDDDAESIEAAPAPKRKRKPAKRASAVPKNAPRKRTSAPRVRRSERGEAAEGDTEV